MKNLSKSQYVLGRQCVKALWLYRHRKDLKAPVDAFQQSIFDHGTEFGQLAHQRIPGGVLIAQGHDDPEGALAATLKAIHDGTTVLYEAAFLYDDVLVRADIIGRNPDGTWTLYEVKSSTKVEEVHLLDVAVQRYVMNGAGFPVTRALVLHADPGYVRYGALDLGRLFQFTDVSDESMQALDDVPRELTLMKQVADDPLPPPKAIGAHCAKPYDCAFKAHCWEHVPAYSVFNIAYLKMDKKLELFNSGVQHVHQVNPDMHKLTAGQRAQVEVARAGVARVDRKAVEKFLASLVYPLTHLDFETDNPVVPPHDGLRPYSQMPFQASVRVQDERGGDVQHHEFLGSGLDDPRDGLMDFLLHRIPTKGSILAYHKSFEAGRLEELAPLAPRFANDFERMVERLADLADPFRTNAYVHPDFRGRWSIKAVLPVLVPDMSYKGLEIQDGAAAMAAYAQLRDPKLPAAERARLTAALKVYCGQDTMAMVKILEHLYAVVGGQVAA